MDHFMDAMKKYTDFSTRSRRKDYWMFLLFYIIFYVVAIIIDGVLGTMFISALFALAMIIPSISVAARRLHDTGRTGWWQLIVLLPIIGTIILIIFLVQDSREDNQYGVNPKAA